MGGRRQTGEESPARPPGARTSRSRYAVAQRGTQRVLPHWVNWQCCPWGHSPSVWHAPITLTSLMHPRSPPPVGIGHAADPARLAGTHRGAWVIAVRDRARSLPLRGRRAGAGADGAIGDATEARLDAERPRARKGVAVGVDRAPAALPKSMANGRAGGRLVAEAPLPVAGFRTCVCPARFRARRACPLLRVGRGGGRLQIAWTAYAP